MNIAVLSCENIKDATCLGCHCCLTGFDKKEGESERYRGADATWRALPNCGGCPGTPPVLPLAGLKTWRAPMSETIDAVHAGTCLLDNCPHKETIVQKVKAGVGVIEGTHPYKPVRVFRG